MKSYTTARFRKAFGRLPDPIKRRARRAYRQFEHDPGHPSLRFKKVHPSEPIFSVRVSRDYRALGLRTADSIVWFWIGSHSDYDALIGSQ